MILAVFVRLFPAAVFLPFVALPGSKEWISYTVPVFIAVGATALSFTQNKFLAVLLAVLVAGWTIVRTISALVIWWNSNFVWIIIPDLCLALAALTKWLAQSCDSALSNEID